MIDIEALRTLCIGAVDGPYAIIAQCLAEIERLRKQVDELAERVEEMRWNAMGEDL